MIRRAPSVLLACCAAALLVALPVAGCVNQRDAAAQAVTDAEAAAAKSAIARLKQRMKDGDAAGIVAAVPEISASLDALQSAAAQRKIEALALLESARSDWTRLSSEMPTLLNSLQKRLEALGRSGQLPPGVDRAMVERARKELDSLKAAWAKALESFAAGRVPEAADEARESRERAQALLDELGANTA
jgi:signal transduction histidine kinase